MSKEGIVARTPIEPAGDTRPIAEEDLLDDQRKVLKELYDRIDGFCQRVAKTRHERNEHARRKQRSSEPWRPIDDDRPNQVLMLDGRRGTGKTSLLLTALKSWRDSRAHTDGMRVIALDPVDFDPMPAGLSPFAWVVLTLRRMVDWLDDDCSSASATAPYLWDDDRDEVKPTLDALWQAFFRRAEIGWSKPARQDDIEDFIQHSREKQKGWLKLQDAWERLIDGLFEAAERQRKVSKDSVIVLPIDDLDLAPRRAREVLLTLRQLYHERVVFLLTGDVAHLRNVLELRQFGAEWVEGAPKAQRKRTWRRTRGLASDLVDKVIPPPHRLGVKALGFWEALQLAANLKNFGGPDSAVVDYLIYCLSSNSTEEEVRARFKAQATQIYEVAHGKKGRSFHPIAAYRIRDLVQAIERPLESDPRGHLYSVLTSARPLDGSPILDHSALRGRSLRIIPRSWGGTGDPDRFHMRATRFTVWDDEGNRPLNVIEQIVLRTQLLPLMITDWNTSGWLSPLAQTDLRLATNQLSLPWPGFPVTNLADVDQKARLLSYYDLTRDLFRAWLSAHLVWSGVETDIDRSLPLTDVLERIVLAADSSLWVRNWLTERLPALCAPEHGLADEVCYGVFQAVARLATGNDDWENWNRAWTQTRMAMLGAFRDSDPEAADLANIIDRKYSRHAWHNRGALGPTGSWLDFKGTSNLRLDNAVYAHHPPGMHGPSLSETLLLTRFKQNERPQHWATSTVTRFLVSGGNIPRFVEAVEALERSFGRKWAAKYLVGIWEELVAQTPEAAPDLIGWFESRKTGDGLLYNGPQGLELSPRWIEFRGPYPSVPDGWQASEPLPEHLVAWLCIVQAYASRMPSPLEDITVPRISDGDAFPAWPKMDWLTAEYALKMWEAAQKKFSEAPELEDVVHDAYLMNWLACATEAMALGSIYKDARVEMPVSVQDIERFLENVFGDRNGPLPAEAKPALKAWLREIRPTVQFKTPDLSNAWLDWWRKHDEHVSISAASKLSKMSADEILKAVQDDGLAQLLHEYFESGKAAARLEDLAEIKHVGPKSIAKLKALAETLE